MKMDKVASSGNDEFYTPCCAVEPILKYVKEGSTVWCPFDTEESNFVKLLREKRNCKVICTHIENEQDFFFSYYNCDYIISNPPYSCKGAVLKRLFSFNKPFAMLVGVVGLFESQERFNMFKENEFEIMYLNKRVSYLKSYSDAKPALNPPFSSVYICHKMLPKQIVFEEVKK